MSLVVSNVMWFQQTPTILFDDPIPKLLSQISPHKHQKMHKGCRNDYIEAFGAVNWGQKTVRKNLWGCNNPRFGGGGVNINFVRCLVLIFMSATESKVLFQYSRAAKHIHCAQNAKTVRLCTEF